MLKIADYGLPTFRSGRRKSYKYTESYYQGKHAAWYGAVGVKDLLKRCNVTVVVVVVVAVPFCLTIIRKKIL